jgi:hypothetical protein
MHHLKFKFTGFQYALLFRWSVFYLEHKHKTKEKYENVLQKQNLNVFIFTLRLFYLAFIHCYNIVVILNSLFTVHLFLSTLLGTLMANFFLFLTIIFYLCHIQLFYYLDNNGKGHVFFLNMYLHMQVYLKCVLILTPNRAC